MIDKALLEEAMNSIIRLDAQKAADIAKKALDEGLDPIELLAEGFTPGISEVGDRFGRGEMFLPELILAANIMQEANDILKKGMKETAIYKKGIIIIGTVEGDVHDIGKGIVVSLLQANGFKVYDLGRDVKTETFIKKAIELSADIIGTSALLTNTMQAQKNLEEELKKAGIRNKVKTIVGGAPVTKRWAEKIGADAYAEDAQDGVKKVKELMGL